MSNLETISRVTPTGEIILKSGLQVRASEDCWPFIEPNRQVLLEKNIIYAVLPDSVARTISRKNEGDMFSRKHITFIQETFDSILSVTAQNFDFTLGSLSIRANRISNGCSFTLLLNKIRMECTPNYFSLSLSGAFSYEVSDGISRFTYTDDLNAIINSVAAEFRTMKVDVKELLTLNAKELTASVASVNLLLNAVNGFLGGVKVKANSIDASVDAGPLAVRTAGGITMSTPAGIQFTSTQEGIVLDAPALYMFDGVPSMAPIPGNAIIDYPTVFISKGAFMHAANAETVVAALNALALGQQQVGAVLQSLIAALAPVAALDLTGVTATALTTLTSQLSSASTNVGTAQGIIPSIPNTKVWI